VKWSSPPMMNSAIGIEWMPAGVGEEDLVSAIPDFSTFPTPAAAEWTQRRPPGARQQVGGEPEPEIGLRLLDQSRSPPARPLWPVAVRARRRPHDRDLPARGGFGTQPGLPAGVSAQFFDVAARSTTSRRVPSVKVDSEDEWASHQLPLATSNCATGRPA
jgi:hypothetical protein